MMVACCRDRHNVGWALEISVIACVPSRSPDAPNKTFDWLSLFVYYYLQRSALYCSPAENSLFWLNFSMDLITTSCLANASGSDIDLICYPDNGCSSRSQTHA